MNAVKSKPAADRYTELRLIRRGDVLRMTGLSRSHMYDLIKRGSFPRPVKASARASRWVQHEVVQWIRERMRTRD